VELPTYTNIWKIEKRLYKLYDFRLPMPLPVGQIAAFLAIAVPYTLILTFVGMPFSHTWLWLYLLPPGVLAWLVTRPVLEGKRLPELVMSQLRYLGEPRTWCRMAPLAEKDEILVSARVWRSAGYLRPAATPAAVMVPEQVASQPAAARPAASQPAAARPAAARPAMAQSSQASVRAPAGAQQRESLRVRERTGAQRPAAAQAAAAQPAVAQPAFARPTAAQYAAPEPEVSLPVVARAAVPEFPPPAEPHLPVRSARATQQPNAQEAASPQAAAAEPAGGSGPGTARPAVRITGDGSPVGPLNVVERALRSSPADRPAGRRETVVVVPGGHRPGKPDQVQRDQARARLPLPVPARVVVLGCTAGAGQTMTTLLTGQLLASLRGEAVAVLDLSQGDGSLTEQARSIPVLLPSQRAGADLATGQGNAGERGLQVVSAGGSGEDAGQIINSVVTRYRLTLADPEAARVPKSLRVADQLILVAPASADAAAALALTLEWLEAHDYGRLAEAAITVLNGVSALTTQHASKAAAVVSGRCRAIVQVPWDERLRGRSAQSLGLPTVHAYTALAGVLVSSLADAVTRSAAR
jgi:hypothetical protein